MIVKHLIAISGCLLLSTVLVSCGNKGDLFLIPDSVSREDMQQLQRILNTSEIPTAEPIDVDDQNVYVIPDGRVGIPLAAHQLLNKRITLTD